MHAACVFQPTCCCCALHGAVFARLAQSLHHIRPMGAAACQSAGLLCCAGGDLYEELKRSGGQMKEKRTSRDVLQPCLSALAYLHTKVCRTGACADLMGAARLGKSLPVWPLVRLHTKACHRWMCWLRGRSKRKRVPVRRGPPSHQCALHMHVLSRQVQQQ